MKEHWLHWSVIGLLSCSLLVHWQSDPALSSIESRSSTESTHGAGEDVSNAEEDDADETSSDVGEE